MSNRPGIGADWLKFYMQDVYTNDYVIVRGHKSRSPKYYDKMLAREDEDKLAHFKETREWRAYQLRDDNTDARLAAKEIVQQAQLKQLVRGKI